MVYEVTLSSPTVEAAEKFLQANLIYDDSGDFDADPTPDGMLSELPESWHLTSFKEAVTRAWQSVRECLDDIGESVKEHLDKEEEYFRSKIQP